MLLRAEGPAMETYRLRAFPCCTTLPPVCRD